MLLMAIPCTNEDRYNEKHYSTAGFAEMSRPTIVFDLDGTLVDSNRDLVPALNRTTAHDGLPPISRADVGHVVGQGALMMIKRAFEFHNTPLDPERHKELLPIFLETYEAHIADETVYYDGVLNALDVLAKHGWILAVCTNKYEHLARKLLTKIGGIERFAAITGGDTFAKKKPDPSHIIETIKMAGGEPENAVMVGDSINDIDAAHAAKIPVIAVDFGYSDVPVEQLNPTKIISHFDSLVEEALKLAVVNE
jgi:phosphoglycolate phosphatase